MTTKKDQPPAPTQPEDKKPDSRLRHALIISITGFVCTLICSYLIFSLYARQWRRIGLAVYADPHEPVLIIEDSDVIIEDINLDNAPAATFSAAFVNDLIHAIMEATSTPQIITATASLEIAP